ncbi:hypothetical protein [Pseudomonas paracarnis]|uniref:hypothetical protein n=1 Tax=Pseudomonas paracarnis TaxID=2750625 RepID=UPI001C6FB1B1|nr:hypothetical protein [Pseudomonas paracarnis]MBW9244239.1 hypothetical protein [Pseudomonas paracarnis]
MADKNQYGLGRGVDAAIKREIRRRCGFGCVICGLAYYDYEHFNPDFKDAKEHDPNGMTLLCMQCNQKRARGSLSAYTVARANEKPRCKEDGFASELFDFWPDPIDVKFAGVSFVNCRVLIRICGIDVLSVRPPEEPGSPVLLSGLFSDSIGAPTLKIVDNVWSAGDENWDVETVGPVITIRRGLGDIALRIRVSPPKSLTIEKIDMQFEGYYLKGDEKYLSLSKDGKNWNSFSSSITNCDVGINCV